MDCRGEAIAEWLPRFPWSSEHRDRARRESKTLEEQQGVAVLLIAVLAVIEGYEGPGVALAGEGGRTVSQERFAAEGLGIDLAGVQLADAAAGLADRGGGDRLWGIKDVDAGV